MRPVTYTALCAAMASAGVEVHVLLDEDGAHRIRLVDFHRLRSLELPVTRGFDAEVLIACCSLALCPDAPLAQAWPELVGLAAVSDPVDPVRPD